MRLIQQPPPLPVRDLSSAPPGWMAALSHGLARFVCGGIFEKEAGRSAQAHAANPGATLAVTTSTKRSRATQPQFLPIASGFEKHTTRMRAHCTTLPTTAALMRVDVVSTEQ